MTRAVALLALALVAGCGTASGEKDVFPALPGGAVPGRRGTVIVSGCSLDAWQRDALASPSMRKVVAEVVLLCGTAREDGELGPVAADDRDAVTAEIGSLHAEGYRVSFGVYVGDALGAPFSPEKTRVLLGDPTFRASIVSAIGAWQPVVDGFDLALSPVPDAASDAVRSFVHDVAAAVRPTSTVSVFVPPVVEDGDVPGGAAFDLASLSPDVDRFRVMTLDYATDSPGPTTDPGWAVDALRRAASKSSGPALDVSMPLYGTDWGPNGTRSVGYLEAMAIANERRASVQRGPTGAPYVTYSDDEGGAHEVWFDDATSTLLVLEAWDPTTLPPDVGVTFYGLGAEDPALWGAIAGRMP